MYTMKSREDLRERVNMLLRLPDYCLAYDENYLKNVSRGALYTAIAFEERHFVSRAMIIVTLIWLHYQNTFLNGQVL